MKIILNPAHWILTSMLCSQTKWCQKTTKRWPPCPRPLPRMCCSRIWTRTSAAKSSTPCFRSTACPASRSSSRATRVTISTSSIREMWRWVLIGMLTQLYHVHFRNIFVVQGVCQLRTGDDHRRRRQLRRTGTHLRNAAGGVRACENGSQAVGHRSWFVSPHSDGFNDPQAQNVRGVLVARFHSG